MPRWYLYTPGNVYAMGPVEAPSRKAALQKLRDFEGVKRLPRGSAVWPADAKVWDGTRFVTSR